MERKNRVSPYGAPKSDTLADILERVLDTGVVIAGDIRVQLADIELLTIQIRLIVCSVDKAQEIGLNWWQHAGFLTGEDEAKKLATSEAETKKLEALDDRLDRLESMIAAMAESK